MRLFIFAIGGTGARVLKSMVMLLASGVRPVGSDGSPVADLEVVPMLIDPHKSNEDLKRTESLLNHYRSLRRAIHGDNRNAEGYFATRIASLREVMSNSSLAVADTFTFNLSAVEQNKFRDFIGYDTMNEANQALTSLLFADYQLENKMSIGFVGSPNIGSVALNEVKDSDEFRAFAGVFSEGDRIFFISSIFGGTGAAGFPILVKNIRQADRLEVTNKHVLRNAPIGALTVMPYFNLEHSDDRRIDRADFVVKTQSALQYYSQTMTGARDAGVNAIFYVGDQVPSVPYVYDPGDRRDQHDPAHLVELVGALAPLRFLNIGTEELVDQWGNHCQTKAFEYGLETDTVDINFLSVGGETRSLLFKRMTAFHLLYTYLSDAFKRHIGRGFTQDAPKITADFTASQFFRTLTGAFFELYDEWLAELSNNVRHVRFFDVNSHDMNTFVTNVRTRKTVFGRKQVDPDVLLAEMNRLSRDQAKRYAAAKEPFKLLDLFNQAAVKVIDERYESTF